MVAGREFGRRLPTRWKQNTIRRVEWVNALVESLGDKITLLFAPARLQASDFLQRLSKRYSRLTLILYVIDEMAQGMFKGAGEDLPLKVNGQEFQAFVGGFETCHGEFLPSQ